MGILSTLPIEALFSSATGFMIFKLRGNPMLNIVPSLSKSQYVKGAQCSLSLWYSRNRKDLTPPVDASQQAMFDAGNEIGNWAKKCFPNGVEVMAVHYAVTDGIQMTKDFIESRQNVIFEATAINPTDGTYSRIDILRRVEGTDTWDMIEVKGSTSVKDYHLEDMAFQYRVFTGAGYNINQCLMMVIDNQYVRDGDINPNKLFRLEDITRVVQGKQAEVERTLSGLSTVMQSSEEPIVKIGARCFRPFECGYMPHCWKAVPDYSIYNVYTKEKAEEIVENLGSYGVESLPPELRPTGIKGLDVQSYIDGEVYVEPENIRRFLNGLQYPLYYLDYETIGSAIPPFDGARPFQAVPFQFSLHVQDTPDAELKHFDFLHREQSDPRPAFIEALISLCGNAGSVVTYNQAFEEGVNKGLMVAFPDYKDQIQAINVRMVDLLVPFKKRWLYHPNQHGSASIKKVLPAFTKETYDGMGISNGLDASSQYANFMQNGLPDADSETLFKNLTEYCCLDTYAMKVLVDVLREKGME
jgi:hypothetical protein